MSLQLKRTQFPAVLAALGVCLGVFGLVQVAHARSTSGSTVCKGEGEATRVGETTNYAPSGHNCLGTCPPPAQCTLWRIGILIVPQQGGGQVILDRKICACVIDLGNGQFSVTYDQLAGGGTSQPYCDLESWWSQAQPPVLMGAQCLGACPTGKTCQESELVPVGEGDPPPQVKFQCACN